MLEATRILTPVRYSPVAPTEHGPATPTKPIPMLQPITRLAKLAPDSDEYGFLRNSLVRKQNAVVRALLDATRVLKAALCDIR
jgi:hypothetical protein